MVLLNDLSKLDMFTVGFGDMQKRLLEATENLAKSFLSREFTPSRSGPRHTQLLHQLFEAV